MSKPFIHLHVHSEYSLLDGAAKLKNLLAKVEESGANAVAITDHGNMYATIKFYMMVEDYNKKHKNNPLNYIVGSEFYVTDDMHKREGRNTENKLNHLVLLAKNNDGYKNLAKLSSLSFVEGFYYKPRIDLETLSKYSGGLICLSACLAGAIPQYLLRNDYEGAKNYALKLKGMFDEGDFYIELQNHGLDEQLQTNPLLVKIAKEIGVKCVATNDIHYIKKSDARMHDALLCIQTASYIDEPNRMKFPCDEFYYKSYDEMEAVLGWCPESLETPYEIAEKCHVSFVFNQYQLPAFPCPDNLTPPEYLRKLCYEGLVKRYGVITDEIRERAETELDVIIKMGFSEYYLIVWDFINYSKTHDIPVGAGRGSGVGSIVAYAITITNIDPLKYDLIFERFLNINRKSMPDFDIDFCYARRSEVIDYVKRQYTPQRISQIITFGRMKRKQAIKDVARVFRLPFADVSKLTKNIPGNFGDNDKKVHIADLINPNSPFAIPELIEQYTTVETYKDVLDIAIQIEDMPRNTGMHAAGVVIYKNPAMDTIPLAKNGEEVTTQYNMVEVEKLGLLKMDFLALMTLTDIKMAHDYVKRRTGIDINFEKLGYDDVETYNLIGSGDTDAVFQLEGGGMKKFMSRLKPTNLEDIIAGISMYRPGPLQNIDSFLENRKHPESIKYKHPTLEPILRVTSGIMIYQEQAMMVTRALAGYDMARADGFRAIISKKKTEYIPKEREIFVNGLVDEDGTVIVPGCVRNGIPAEVATAIFAEMESFASYAFNKSHAAAYSALSYETAYYKRYYPVEFLAAVINNRIDKPDDTEKYMLVMKNMNIPLLQPDINKSEPLFSPTEGSIRYGLACIKNVGKTLTENIQTERETNGDFKDLYDFIKRMHGQINKRAVECLIKGGAFDCFGYNRATLIANYEAIFTDVERKKKFSDTNQMNFFDLLGETDLPYEYKLCNEYNNLDKLLQEKEMLGMYVTGHPLAGYEKDFEMFNFSTMMLPKTHEDDDEEDGGEVVEEDESNPYNLEEGMEVRTGGLLADFTIKRTKDGKEMAVGALEDMYDRIEIVIFARVLQNAKKLLSKDMLVKLKGRLSYKDSAPKITVNAIEPWSLTKREDSAAEQAPEVVDERSLYLRLRPQDDDKLIRINRILEAHPGKSAVKIQVASKVFLHNITVGDLDDVAKELIGIVGAENIKVF